MFALIPTDPLIYLASWFGFDIINFARTCQRHAYVSRYACKQLSKHLRVTIIKRCCRRGLLRPMEYIPRDWLLQNITDDHLFMMEILTSPRLMIWAMQLDLSLSHFPKRLMVDAFDTMIIRGINIPEDIISFYVQHHGFMTHITRISECISVAMIDNLQNLLNHTTDPSRWNWMKPVERAIIYRRKQALKILLQYTFVVDYLPKYLPDWLPKDTPTRYRRMILRAMGV